MELEQTISETPTPENLDKYYDIKSTPEALCTNRTRGSIIRSRVQHISEKSFIHNSKREKLSDDKFFFVMLI